jgi:hypothetical protein
MSIRRRSTEGECMLAREYCDHVKGKRKPIILSHHILYGLK